MRKVCLKLSLYQNPIICHVQKVPKRSHVTCSKFSWAFATSVGSCCADSWTPFSWSLPTETCSTGFTSPVGCASFWFVTACFSWHMREGKSVSSLALQIRVKCKEFCRITQNSFKRDGIHTFHNTECMQKTRFQLRKPRGKKKRKTGRNNSRRRSPAICPRIFLSSYPYCRRVQCLVETL